MHPHLQKLFNKLEAIEKIVKEIQMDQQEFAAQLEAQAAIIDQTNATLGKVINEVQQATQTQADAIAALQQEIVNSGSGMSEAAMAALQHIAASNEALTLSVAALDNLNADPQEPAPAS